ncbi:hypothetical protein O9G_001358 [Rozella allomycis CSF55]|uniref:Uncharacterized protein n=1 Tax=Rozella allomycis (strain CSF55) TaxID=988480 RepID=A0A075AQD2_ROZAC|nr:hypothetical protein O9G_001358 [Rozella allomycis CSF55]|eukprot:EPZ32456.1 hypothetical protein O9G_001358 [Rozella allomycis CSF55]
MNFKQAVHIIILVAVYSVVGQNDNNDIKSAINCGSTRILHRRTDSRQKDLRSPSSDYCKCRGDCDRKSEDTLIIKAISPMHSPYGSFMSEFTEWNQLSGQTHLESSDQKVQSEHDTTLVDDSFSDNEDFDISPASPSTPTESREEFFSEQYRTPTIYSKLKLKVKKIKDLLKNKKASPSLTFGIIQPVERWDAYNNEQNLLNLRLRRKIKGSLAIVPPPSGPVPNHEEGHVHSPLRTSFPKDIFGPDLNADLLEEEIKYRSPLQSPILRKQTFTSENENTHVNTEYSQSTSFDEETINNDSYDDVSEVEDMSFQLEHDFNQNLPSKSLRQKRKSFYSKIKSAAKSMLAKNRN